MNYFWMCYILQCLCQSARGCAFEFVSPQPISQPLVIYRVLLLMVVNYFNKVFILVSDKFAFST